MIVSKTNNDTLEYISVKNSNNFEVVFSNLGASIYAIKKNGVFFTQSPVDASTFKQLNVYHGKTIGRIGNRVENGEIIINNKTYYLDKNEKPNTLHGGINGLSNQLFNYEVEKHNEKVILYFHYCLKDLVDGLPGDLNVEVKYTVYNDKDEILIEFNAASNKDTIISLTNHSYYNLSSNNLNDLSLKIKADKFVHPRANDLIPLEVRDIYSTMDFRDFKFIKKDINDPYLTKSRTAGYDHHFIFIEPNKNIPQIELKNNEYKMEIYTDFSGVQIYTDNYPDEDSLWHGVKGNKNRSIAIEPQDSTLNRVITKKNESYKRFIRLVFTKL